MQNTCTFIEGIESDRPLTALAPMQDVTTLPFMTVIGKYGAPDYYVTEYFRVHEHSTLEGYILDSITKNPTGRPVYAQLIGHLLQHMGRTVDALSEFPHAGIDLNMGCPAPKIYKKCVGGGLLRDLEKMDELLGFLRSKVEGRFTVKTRIGFEDTSNFEGLLDLIDKHNVDLFTLHGRTVTQSYRGDVHYDKIKRASERLSCPVIANGNITSAEKAKAVLEYTGCAGVMVGRGAIRNPWIFKQIRDHLAGREVYQPTLSDVRAYVDDLYEVLWRPQLNGRRQAGVIKKFLNFVAQGVDPEGAFLKEMRRAPDADELKRICDKHLLAENAEKPFSSEPYEGVIARPNCEV